VKEAEAETGTVVHTFVDSSLREAINRLGRKHGVVTIDLMGPLLEQVAEQSSAKPLGQAGLYRKLRKDYFDRVEAIDFAVSHDDGNRSVDISRADIVILGVSRCGKTPLSMYLAVHGWKAANIPIIKDIPLPGELSRIDRRRVIGLPRSISRLQAAIMDFVPGKPFSTDNFRSLLMDSVGSTDGLRELGITPRPLRPNLAAALGGAGLTGIRDSYRKQARR